MTRTLAILIVVVALGMVGCSGPTGVKEQQEEADIYVEPLPDDRAEMNIPLPDGTLPCGLGQVEWGHQVFRVEDYLSCQSATPKVTVYCLDNQAQWTSDSINITEVTMGAITLEAQREGICGIFPE